MENMTLASLLKISIVIPILLLILGVMGFMAADAARWRWSIMLPSDKSNGVLVTICKRRHGTSSGKLKMRCTMIRSATIEDAT